MRQIVEGNLEKELVHKYLLKNKLAFKIVIPAKKDPYYYIYDKENALDGTKGKMWIIPDPGLKNYLNKSINANFVLWDLIIEKLELMKPPREIDIVNYFDE